MRQHALVLEHALRLVLAPGLEIAHGLVPAPERVIALGLVPALALLLALQLLLLHVPALTPAPGSTLVLGRKRAVKRACSSARDKKSVKVAPATRLGALGLNAITSPSLVSSVKPAALRKRFAIVSADARSDACAVAKADASADSVMRATVCAASRSLGLCLSVAEVFAVSASI